VPPLQIRGVMTREVVTAAPSTPVAEIAELLTSHRISAVPIIDDRDRVVGVVSEADLLPKIRRLVVTNDAGRLVGIVSRADLIRPLARPDEAVRQDVIDELRHTLWIRTGDVQVHLDAGVATLTGAVFRRSTAAIAARLTETVPGVVAVVDRIRCDFDAAALTSVPRQHNAAVQRRSLHSMTRQPVPVDQPTPVSSPRQRTHKAQCHRQRDQRWAASVAPIRHDRPPNATGRRRRRRAPVIPTASKTRPY
jgi:hypothetical protein